MIHSASLIPSYFKLNVSGFERVISRYSRIATRDLEHSFPFSPFNRTIILNFPYTFRKFVFHFWGHNTVHRAIKYVSELWSDLKATWKRRRHAPSIAWYPSPRLHFVRIESRSLYLERDLILMWVGHALGPRWIARWWKVASGEMEAKKKEAEMK